MVSSCRSTEDILPYPNSVLIEREECRVLNLSDVPLKPTEIPVLSKGLRYVATLRTANEFDLLGDQQQFARRLHLMTYFYGKDGQSETANSDNTRPNFKLKSHWTLDSSKSNVCIENYVQANRRIIFDFLAKENYHKSNFSRKEHVLHNLWSKKDVILRPVV